MLYKARIALKMLPHAVYLLNTTTSPLGHVVPDHGGRVPIVVNRSHTGNDNPAFHPLVGML